MTAAKRRRRLPWFGSYRLRGRDERRRARQAILRGQEPAPKYSTGKTWED